MYGHIICMGVYGRPLILISHDYFIKCRLILCSPQKIELCNIIFCVYDYTDV